jgi:hypothetical protein
MFNYFMKIVKMISWGFRDAFREILDKNYDEQEQWRQNILRMNLDCCWTDDEVWDNFLIYCQSYDNSIRLNRTQQMLKQILENRPEVRQRLKTQKRI